MSESSILNLTELEKAQWERAQQIKIQSSENAAENNDDKNENLNSNLINKATTEKVIQTFISENQENNDHESDSDAEWLDVITRSDRIVRLIKMMK